MGHFFCSKKIEVELTLKENVLQVWRYLFLFQIPFSGEHRFLDS